MTDKYFYCAARGKSLTSVHLEELDDPEKNTEEEVKVVSQQEYVMRLRELNNEIAQAWQQNERVTALKLSIKARILKFKHLNLSLSLLNGWKARKVF
jgi:hypothetical protein